MAYCPGFPGTHDVYPTIYDCYRVVRMEGSNVPGTNIDSTEAEETRRLGLNWHRGEVSSSPDRPYVDTKHEKRALQQRNGSGSGTCMVQGEPPHIGRIPMTLGYLYRYALDMAYIAPPGNDDTLRTFKLCVYNTLHTMAAARRESREMRIKQLHPDTQWMQVWKNLHTAWVSEEIASIHFLLVQTGLGAHPASCKKGSGSFPGVKCGRGVLLTTHPLLVPWSRKSRAIPLPTLWATPSL